MAENSKIEWTDNTFNPWIGCTKISPACDHCYAETLATTRLGVAWGPGAERRRTAMSTWKQPLAWNRKAEKAGVRARVFCASLADVFDNAVPDMWRAGLFDLIEETPNLDWLLLTKRIGNVQKMTDVLWGTLDWPTNVWVGATIATQEEADRDIPKLLATRGPRIRFLSMEPLLGPVNLKSVPAFISENGQGLWSCIDGYCQRHYPKLRCGCPRQELAIDWVITGGESGPKARPSHPDWFRSLRDQCAAAGVPFLFKQWGEWLSGTQYNEACIAADPDLEGSRFDCMDWDGERFDESGGGWMDDLDEDAVFRVGKKRAGRLLDGVEHNGVPA